MRGPAQTVDWNLAKVLRGQGLTWKEISAKTNAKVETLQVRASREGWNAIHKQTAKVLAEYATQTAVEHIKEQAPKLAESWLNTVQANTIKAAEAFDKLPVPKNLQDFKTYEETADKHVKRGRAAFGLDDQKSGGAQVNIMARLVQMQMNDAPLTVSEGVADSVEVNPPSSQAIDVEGEQ